jgi:hypothetical protein
MKQQFLEDKTDTIRITIYSNNRPIVPTSGTITLYSSSGNVLQAEIAATVNSTTGEMTYALTAIHTADIDLNYKAVWTYISGGITYYENQLFDVVKSILSIPITDEDLYNELDSLRKANKQERGTATAGATTSLTDTKRKEEDDFWTGGVIEILSGTGSGQIRDITDFVSSTGVISVDPAFATTPDTTSIYRVIRSFTKKIKQSFEKIEDALYSMGKRHELILESSQIKFALIYLTVHFICLDLMTEVGDKFEKLSETYWKKYQDAFQGMKLEYDEDESGFIDGTDEEAQSSNSIRIFRG